MVQLDAIDCDILDLLQINCRMSLTDISKQVNLSLDSVKKRIDKMLKNNIFHPKIQIRPRKFGYDIFVEVKVKLNFKSKSRLNEFLSYLINHPYVPEIFSVSGNWDYSLVIMAKDSLHLDEISRDIRIKFGDMIRSWTESLTNNVFKFEYYFMRKLMGFEPSNIKFDFLEIKVE